MDSFFGIGIMELFFIAVIAMLVLGPERMPAAIREVAKYIRMIRGLSSELTSQFSEELKMLDEINPQKLLNEFTAPLEDESKTKAKKTTPPASKPAAKPKPATPPKPVVKTEAAATAAPLASDDAEAPAETVEPSTAADSSIDEDTNRILPPQAEEANQGSEQPEVADAPLTNINGHVQADNLTVVPSDERPTDGSSTIADDEPTPAKPLSESDASANGLTLADEAPVPEGAAQDSNSFNVNGKPVQPEGEP